MQIRINYVLAFALFLFITLPARAVSANFCDLFADLKSYDGRSVRLRVELFLDKDQTAAAANCDESFTEESLVWSSVIHLDPGSALSNDDRVGLEGARRRAVESRRLGKHVRITALVEGSVETKRSYSWSSGPGGAIGNAYGVRGAFPARIVLSGISDVEVEILPDAADLPVIDVCEIFSTLTSYEGKRVAIRGEVVSGYHGSAMRGNNCEKPFETDGYRWPSAIYFAIPFNDSHFVQHLESDRKRSAKAAAEASKQIRGRRNVRAIYTAVGIVHTRERYKIACNNNRSIGNGFGEMGFAPAEFYPETSFNPLVMQAAAAGDSHDDSPCPSPKRLQTTDCLTLDIVAAASGGCIDRVRELTSAIRPIARGETALNRAVAAGFADIVSVIVNAGVPVNAPWEDQLPLCAAIESRRTNIAEILLGAGALIENKPESRCSLLGAAGSRDLKMIELLVRHGADLELRDYFGKTPLMIASQFGGAESVGVLLKAGAAINATDADGGTAITHAASSAHLSVISALINAGAKTDVFGMSGVTPLMWAAWESRDDVVRLLLKSGASANLQDDHGDTALHKAMRSGHTDAIPVLLEFGADPEIRNRDGKRPSDLASGFQLEALQSRR